MLVRALGCKAPRVADEVEQRLRDRSGTWTAGVYGALAEFCATDGQPTEVERQGQVVTARSLEGALRFDLTDAAAFAVSLRSRPGDVRSIIVATPRRALNG